MSTFIMVVEDSEPMRIGLKSVLEHEGFNVILAENGKDALEIIENIPPPDLILSDIMMPEMNGIEFFHKIKTISYCKGIPFIFLTAKNEKQDIIQAKKLGVEDYIVKPFDPEDLLATINGKLRRMEELNNIYSDKMDRLRSAIIEKLSHEIKTPLTVIQGWTEFLQSIDSETNLKDILSTIYYSSDRLNSLIERFILLSNFELGKNLNGYKKEALPHKLDFFISNTIEKIKKHYKQKSDLLNFDVDISPENLTVNISKQLISVILYELIDNACKFSIITPPYEPKTISIKAQQNENCVKIQVMDNGIGLPENEIENITQKFYQYNRESYEQQGMGIGLTLIKKIVDFHGGNLHIDSNCEKGTDVKIELPLDKEWEE